MPTTNKRITIDEAVTAAIMGGRRVYAGLPTSGRETKNCGMAAPRLAFHAGGVPPEGVPR